MTDNEKIIMFEKYMKEKNLGEEKIEYNLLVVKLLVKKVLFYFKETLEAIDTYTFEEFTDMSVMIDEQLGGRDGIPKILNAMMELTEFLKINKLIKGGKIAYYKRMFSNCDYYIDKYDMITGKKDDSKEFIREITQNSFTEYITKVVDNINVYEFNTLNKIDKILNDIPFEKKEEDDDLKILKRILDNLQLIEYNDKQIQITKRGRMVSRLEADERYATLLYLIFHNLDFEDIFEDKENENIYRHINDIMTSVFYKDTEVSINLNLIKKLKEEEYFNKYSLPSFRVAKILSIPYGKTIVKMCFVDMGLIDVKRKDMGIAYTPTIIGKELFKLMLPILKMDMKLNISIINGFIKNKKYDLAEKSILNYLLIFGSNTMIWDYLGQLLLIKKQYKYAYSILKSAYENSAKHGKAAKSVLYHLVLCCRKLKLSQDTENYEKKLQILEKI